MNNILDTMINHKDIILRNLKLKQYYIWNW